MLLRSNQFGSKQTCFDEENKKRSEKWKENTFVNLGSTKIAVLFCERCKHRYDTESFFSKLLFYKFLCKILLGFHRSSKTRSKLTEVKSTFSFQFAVCVRSWQFDNCHYLTHMYCSLFKGFPGIVGKTVAITTYFIAANMRVWYKTKKNPTHKACSRCVKKIEIKSASQFSYLQVSAGFTEGVENNSFTLYLVFIADLIDHLEAAFLIVHVLKFNKNSRVHARRGQRVKLCDKLIGLISFFPILTVLRVLQKYPLSLSRIRKWIREIFLISPWRWERARTLSNIFCMALNKAYKSFLGSVCSSFDLWLTTLPSGNQRYQSWCQMSTKHSSEHCSFYSLATRKEISIKQ